MTLYFKIIALNPNPYHNPKPNPNRKMTILLWQFLPNWHYQFFPSFHSDRRPESI